MSHVFPEVEMRRQLLASATLFLIFAASLGAQQPEPQPQQQQQPAQPQQSSRPVFQ